MGDKKEHKFYYNCIKLAAVLFYLLLVSGSIANAQVEESDSLKTDTLKNTVRVQLGDDNASGFQPIDSIKADSSEFAVLPKRKSPQMAALYSAILPGLGQAYNGKYWKIPIIYSIFTGMFFLARDNHQKYEDFKEAYLYFDDKTNKPKWVNEAYQKNDLKDRKDFYKRNRDLNIIIGGLIYLLNILDANVDAHLLYFDIGEDLSLNVQPDMNYFQASQKDQKISGFGIKFVLSLHR